MATSLWAHRTEEKRGRSMWSILMGMMILSGIYDILKLGTTIILMGLLIFWFLVMKTWDLLKPKGRMASSQMQTRSLRNPAKMWQLLLKQMHFQAPPRHPLMLPHLQLRRPLTCWQMVWCWSWDTLMHVLSFISELYHKPVVIIFPPH